MTMTKGKNIELQYNLKYKSWMFMQVTMSQAPKLSIEKKPNAPPSATD